MVREGIIPGPPAPFSGQDATPLPSSVRSLFGGAITCVVPNTFSDVSKIRQVPDNQEVFADPSIDSSLIIEILESSAPAAADQRGAAAWHWDTLAEDSGATTRTLAWAGTLDGATAAAHAPNLSTSGGKLSLAAGLQSVPKFRDAAELANNVRIHLACLELPSVATHLVISTAAPQALHPAGSSARAGAVAAVTPNAPEREAARPFYAALHSLTVVDWSLFGSSAQ